MLVKPSVIIDGEAVQVTTGLGLTNTVTDAVPEHPFLNPVTVYVVVDDGLTMIDDPDCPVLQV